jgi:FKBP-type peptidyl-prolyl cis-trans isomerase FkpA
MNTPLKIGFLLLAGGLAVAFLMPNSGGDVKPPPTTPSSTSKANTVSEFQKIDTVVGNGAEASAGSDVSVHYTGWLHDPSAPDQKGKKFDSSVDRGQAFEFSLCGGRVIKGWDEGVAGMKIGGKRTLIIPAEMGYGARGAGGVIPPNATLVFDVELLGVN